MLGFRDIRLAMNSEASIDCLSPIGVSSSLSPWVTVIEVGKWLICVPAACVFSVPKSQEDLSFQVPILEPGQFLHKQPDLKVVVLLKTLENAPKKTTPLFTIHPQTLQKKDFMSRQSNKREQALPSFQGESVQEEFT